MKGLHEYPHRTTFDQLCCTRKEDLYIKLEENVSLVLTSPDVKASLKEFLVHVAAHSGSVLVVHGVEMYNTVTNANFAPNDAIERYFGSSICSETEKKGGNCEP